MASSKGKSKTAGKVDTEESERLRKFNEQLRKRKAPVPKAK